MNGHLRKTVNFLTVVLLITVSAAGCRKKQPDTEFVARVGSQVLTADALEKIVGKNPSPALREAAIRKWIEREALYLYAGSENIEKSEEYNAILEDAKRDLLAALAKQKTGETAIESITETQVKEWYDKDSSMYRMPENGYIYRTAVFGNDKDAIEFRAFALASGWSQAQRLFKTKAEKISDAVCEGESAVREGNVVRLLGAMEDNEISILLPLGNKFYVFQLIKKIQQNEIIPFDYAKGTALSLLTASKKTEAINELLNKLYSKYEIEIK